MTLSRDNTRGQLLLMPFWQQSGNLLLPSVRVQVICLQLERFLLLEKGPAPLSIRSHQNFEATSPIVLPRGHPTIALNQDQIGRDVRIETAKESFDVLNRVVIRASQWTISGVSRSGTPSDGDFWGTVCSRLSISTVLL